MRLLTLEEQQLDMAFLHRTLLEKHKVDPKKIQEYDIVCFPHNWFEKEHISEMGFPDVELEEADDTASLSQQLEAARLTCASSQDLGIKTGPAPIKFSAPVPEIWLGLVQIIKDTAIPVLAAVIATWLVHKAKDAKSNERPIIPRVTIDIIRKCGENLDQMHLDMPADCAGRVIAALREENEGNE